MKQFDIALLGSGWLGLPLARHFHQQGLQVAASTRQLTRFPEIETSGALPFLVDINNRNDRGAFLNSRILIINITCKNIESFQYFIKQIECSLIEKVLLVSSSSVYRNLQREVSEDEAAENPESVLFQIEQLFRNNPNFQTTILRCSGLIDSRRHPGRFFRHGKQIQQPDAPVNLVHLHDVIGIIDAIIARQAWGDVFNASADSHPSKRAFYSYARTLLDLPPPDCADNDSADFKIVSNIKVKQQLGYRFYHPDLMQIQF